MKKQSGKADLAIDSYSIIVPPHLLGQDLLGSYGFGLTPRTGCAFCVRPPVPNW